MTLFLIGVVLGFVAGVYRSQVQKEAVAVGLKVFTEAKTTLSRVIVKARTEAQAEAQRLIELEKKYL